MPNVNTLGDILEKDGYTRVFMIGSDATFGGRRSYFDQHGHYDIQDTVSLKEEGVLVAERYIRVNYLNLRKRKS